MGRLHLTLYEHENTIRALQVLNNKLLISASTDGVVFLTSIDRIDTDVTVQSSATIEARFDNNNPKSKMKINCLRTIGSSNRFAYGTETGVIDLFKVSSAISDIDSSDSQVVQKSS